jgi:dienelactone hydrolase
MKVQKIEYFDDATLLEATVAYQEGEKKRPIIFIFHAWRGKDDFVEKKAKDLAELGYIGCALDMYGKGVLGTNDEENSALMTPLIKDREKLRKRILAYRMLLEKIPTADVNRQAAIGFCFGGLCALDLARSGAEVKGVVSFHGLLKAPEGGKTPPIHSKILVLHGHDDPSIPPDQVLTFEKEMTEKKVDWQMHIFSGTAHAFTNPLAKEPDLGRMYNATSDKRSWNLMK